MSNPEHGTLNTISVSPPDKANVPWMQAGAAVRIVLAEDNPWYLVGSKAVVCSISPSHIVQVRVLANGINADSVIGFTKLALAPWIDSPMLAHVFRWIHWNRTALVYLWSDQTITFGFCNAAGKADKLCEPHGLWQLDANRLVITFDHEAWVPQVIAHEFVPQCLPDGKYWKLFKMWGPSKVTAHSWCVLAPCEVSPFMTRPQALSRGASSSAHTVHIEGYEVHNEESPVHSIYDADLTTMEE